MSETIQTVLAFVILIGVVIYTKKIQAVKMIQARDAVFADLRAKGALSEETAVYLEYARTSYLKVGFRDFRPKVIKQLVQFGLLGMTAENTFYLNESAVSQVSDQS